MNCAVLPLLQPALNSKGDQYRDPPSKFLAGEDSYILLRVKSGGKMTVEIKNLAGEVLDCRKYERTSE